MRGLQTKYDGKVKFIRINIDEKDSQAILKKYNVRGTPTIVLLDKAGRVASNAPGWVSEQAADDALKALAALP